MITGIAIYTVVKFWLPIVTSVGLIWRAYKSAGKAISGWANTLLDNHMAHIQDAAEKASLAVVELAQYHKEMLQSQKDIATAMSLMTQDFHEHKIEDLRVQSAILTGIEVIKAKVD